MGGGRISAEAVAVFARAEARRFLQASRSVALAQQAQGHLFGGVDAPGWRTGRRRCL